ncbi:hypothetical protein Q7P37_007002 [Cladosporium fusiforme]
MADTIGLAPYACDSCRSRKISCSRKKPVCVRCNNDQLTCAYSRSGILRRKRKRKHESEPADATSLLTPSSVASRPEIRQVTALHETTNHDGEVQSHLTSDIESTRGLLQGIGAPHHNSLGALSSLSKACAMVWQNEPESNKSGQSFFLFEDRADSWADTFVSTLQRGHPILACKPADEVVQHLRTAQPHLVRERAWLVMYYSIILSMISSTAPEDSTTKDQLKCNLWLAVNDAKILLEPSEPNIQALALLATHVEEFTSPSLCHMLIASACRMLQALGVTSRNLSPETRQRRTMTFWYLNLVDKGLSIIFGRPPTFHRAMTRSMPLPTAAQLIPYEPHNKEPQQGARARSGSLFGAHYIHQIMLLSHVIGDIWSCIYDTVPLDQSAIDSSRKDLQNWYASAKPMLDAAAMAEKPLLDDGGIASINLGLNTLEFNYHYLLIILGRTSGNMKAETIRSSKEMLHLLRHLVSDSEEVYNGIMLASRGLRPGEDEEALMAMKELPLFLRKMGLRNSLAARLESIAVVFVQHAESLVGPSRGLQDTQIVQGVDTSQHVALEPWPDAVDWDSFLSHTTTATVGAHAQFGDQHTFPGGDVGDGGMAEWTDLFLGDASIDWIGFGASMGG